MKAGEELAVAKKPARVADAELSVLKVLWARGPLTAKAITEVLYPDGAESEFAAVHSFLQRLERKVVSETAQARKSAVYMAIVPLLLLVVYAVIDPVNTERLFTTFQAWRPLPDKERHPC